MELGGQAETGHPRRHDSSDWVVTTPSASLTPRLAPCDSCTSWSVSEVIELEQLKQRYYEPGLLSKVMGFSD